MENLLAEVSRLPPRTIVLFTTLFQDGAGESFVPHEVVERVAAIANAPVYGPLDQYLGRGIDLAAPLPLARRAPPSGLLRIGRSTFQACGRCCASA
jgi:hypothetical protein